MTYIYLCIKLFHAFYAHFNYKKQKMVTWSHKVCGFRKSVTQQEPD